MTSNFYSYQQKNLWNEVIQAISISKQMSVGYVSAVKDHKSDSNEMLTAFKKSSNTFIIIVYDD